MKIPGAKSGENGHNATYHVACILVRDFRLQIEEALPIFQEWNATCEPPWSEKELRHKLEDAAKDTETEGYGASSQSSKVESGLGATDEIHTERALLAPELEKEIDDPHRLARIFLQQRYNMDGFCSLRFWRQQWWRWRDGAYGTVEEKELAAELWREIEVEFNRVAEGCDAAGPVAPRKGAATKAKVKKVTNSLVNNVLGALSGLTTVRGEIEQPAWLLPNGEMESRKLIGMRNGLLDLEALLSSEQPHLERLTPNWFSPICLPYAFDAEAKCPKWDAFLAKNLEAVQGHEP
jgi:putative DNA primase/helicase